MIWGLTALPILTLPDGTSFLPINTQGWVVSDTRPIIGEDGVLCLHDLQLPNSEPFSTFLVFSPPLSLSLWVLKVSFCPGRWNSKFLSLLILINIKRV